MADEELTYGDQSRKEDINKNKKNMPYGPVKKGIKETPAQTKMMEACVKGVMKEGKDKSTAIAICKISLRKAMEKRTKK